MSKQETLSQKLKWEDTHCPPQPPHACIYMSTCNHKCAREHMQPHSCEPPNTQAHTFYELGTKCLVATVSYKRDASFLF